VFREFFFISPVRNKQKRSSQFGQAQKKKEKKKGAIQQQPNKRKHISVVRLNNAVVDMLQGTGARNQTQRGMVSFQIQLTSLFIYYTYIYFSVFFFRKTSEMLCVCS
jgi:hypothetical protein